MAPPFFRFGGDRLRLAAMRGVVALLRWGFCWRLCCHFYRLSPAPPHRFAFGEGFKYCFWRRGLGRLCRMRRRRLAETPMLHFSLWLRSSTKRFEDEGAAVPIWMGLVETDFVCRMPQDLGLLGRRSRFSGFVCPAAGCRGLWLSEFGAGGKCPFALRQDAAGSRLVDGIWKWAAGGL